MGIKDTIAKKLLTITAIEGLDKVKSFLPSEDEQEIMLYNSIAKVINKSSFSNNYVFLNNDIYNNSGNHIYTITKQGKSKYLIIDIDNNSIGSVIDRMSLNVLRYRKHSHQANFHFIANNQPEYILKTKPRAHTYECKEKNIKVSFKHIPFLCKIQDFNKNEVGEIKEVLSINNTCFILSFKNEDDSIFIIQVLLSLLFDLTPFRHSHLV